MIRSDWQKDKVAIVSGGGSGHEPFAAGLVGSGGITGAVCGSVKGVSFNMKTDDFLENTPIQCLLHPQLALF